jgi:signal peptidase II
MKKGGILIVIFILIDQLTKQLAKALITMDQVWIPELLSVGFRKNTGSALGSFDNQQFFFMLVTLIALGLFGYMFLKVDFKLKKVYSWAIILFIAGTFGNAIDRVLLNYVIDFLHYPFLDYIIGETNNFYNNFADLYLSAAIVLFTIEIFILEPKREKKEKINEANNQSE